MRCRRGAVGWLCQRRRRGRWGYVCGVPSGAGAAALLLSVGASSTRPAAAAATARMRALAGMYSSSTGSPDGPHSGSIQFGYSIEVPGMFWERVSPAASARLTPIKAAGVRAR